MLVPVPNRFDEDFNNIIYNFKCVVICKSDLLDFVHRLYFNKITTFRKLVRLLSSVLKEGQEPELVGPPG
jgi:hypothetical protein